MAGHIVRRGSAQSLSWFVVGVVAGLFLKEAAQKVREHVRRKKAHLDYERTVSYEENLPDPLERREPTPHTDQPRFGGTGAIGFSPTAAMPRDK